MFLLTKMFGCDMGKLATLVGALTQNLIASYYVVFFDDFTYYSRNFPS